jgi:hypothetical protein
MKKKPRDQASPGGSWPEGPERAGGALHFQNLKIFPLLKVLIALPIPNWYNIINFQNFKFFQLSKVRMP